MPVRKMLSEIDSYELTEWMAYLNIEAREREKEDKKREAQAKSAAAPSSPNTFGRY